MSADARRARSRRQIAAVCVLLCASLPGSVLGQPADDNPIGDFCFPSDPQCDKRHKVQEKSNLARQELNYGDAEAAVENIDGALTHWQNAVNAKTDPSEDLATAQASVIAQKRIQMYTLTTKPEPRRYEALLTAMGGEIVNATVIQRSLKTLSYYDGPLTGRQGIITRSAIRKFQRDMAFDETDDLSPRQVVYLIGNAAETARDPAAQKTLALMYAAGAGVSQRYDFTLAWLRASSARFHGEATYYLSILYGTGHCGFPHRLDLADQYLKEACAQKDPLAIELFRRYSAIADPVSRWAKIGADPIVKHSLDILGECPRPRENKSGEPDNGQ